MLCVELAGAQRDAGRQHGMRRFFCDQFSFLSASHSVSDSTEKENMGSSFLSHLRGMVADVKLLRHIIAGAPSRFLGRAWTRKQNRRTYGALDFDAAGLESPLRFTI